MIQSQSVAAGSIPLQKLPIILAGAMMLTCLFNLYLCNKQGTCAPWPHSTITNCSTMYPNNVLFRFFLLVPSVGYLIIFSCFQSWCEYQSKKSGNKVKVPSLIKTFGYLGFPFFVLAVATIDQGKMDNYLHSLGAVIFFVLWAFDCWVMFFTLLNLFKHNPLITSYKSLAIKGAMCFIQWLVIIRFIINALQPKNPDENNDTVGTPDDVNPVWLVDIEWGTMLTCLIFIASISFEFKNITMSLDENHNFEFHQICGKKAELETKMQKKFAREDKIRQVVQDEIKQAQESQIEQQKIQQQYEQAENQIYQQYQQQQSLAQKTQQQQVYANNNNNNNQGFQYPTLLNNNQQQQGYVQAPQRPQQQYQDIQLQQF